MLRTLLITTAGALALTACNDKPDEATDGNVKGLGSGAASTVVEDTAAQGVGGVTAPMANSVGAFVTNATISDMYEIEAGRIASEKAKSPQVKAFAQMMVKDHTATSTKLKTTLAGAEIRATPPTALDARRQGMIDNLKSASSENFDKVYLDQQTAAHQEALTLMQSYADDGDNQQLKTFAAQTAPKIQQHYDHVRQLDSAGADDTK